LNKWADHPTLLQVVEEVWVEDVFGLASFAYLRTWTSKNHPKNLGEWPKKIDWLA